MTRLNYLIRCIGGHSHPSLVLFPPFFIYFVVLLSRFSVAEQPMMLSPLPQKVQYLDRQIALDTPLSLYLEESDSLQIASGVQHLEGVLEKMGAGALQRIEQPEAADVGPRIIVGSVGGSALVRQMVLEMGLDITESEPGPQGYVIKVSGAPGEETVLLAGCDETGAMYALVTLAQLLHLRPVTSAEQDARVLEVSAQFDTGMVQPVLELADIRDWPDFKTRMLVRGSNWKDELWRYDTPEGFLQVGREMADFCLANKINGVSLRWFSIPHSETPVRSQVELVSREDRELLRQMMEYGHARGVRYELHGYSAVERYAGEFPELDLMRTHGVGYSWSHDDLLKRSAKRMAEFARDIDVDFYFLHAPDRTRRDDFGGFRSRSKQCRERWADDQRAEADAHVMQIFYDIIKEKNPDIRICAVLVPYGASVGNLESELGREVLDYWRRANELLPDDMLICVRENTRKNIESFRNSFQDHPIYFYIEPVAWRTIFPYLGTTYRMARTFYFGNSEDVYFISNLTWDKRLGEALQSHFCWNTKAPGWGMHRTYNFNPYTDVTEPEVVAEDTIDAIYSRMLGREAGLAVARAGREGAAWNLIEDPERVLYFTQRKFAGKDTDIPGWEAVNLGDFSRTSELVREHAAKGARGLAMLLPVAERLAAGELTLGDWQRRHFYRALNYHCAVQALGTPRGLRIAAKDALADGRIEEASVLVTQGLDSTNAMLALVGRVENLSWPLGEWPRGMHGLKEWILGERGELEMYEKLLMHYAEGAVEEQADTPEAMQDAAPLLTNPEVLRFQPDREDAGFSVERADARTEGKVTLRLAPKDPEGDRGRGAVFFDPVDLRPFLESGGYLRFYINSAGGNGGQQMMFSLATLGADGKTSPRQRWVYFFEPNNFLRKKFPDRAGGFVEIDGLPMHWQLVSIPLRDLVAEGAVMAEGLRMAFTRHTEESVLIAEPYLIEATEPVPSLRPVRGAR